MKPLTDQDLQKSIRRLTIKHFRGIWMLDELPTRPKRNETAIVNLDSSHGPGTHWVAYAKRGNTIVYFDSFGNLKPPKKLVEYFNNGSTIKRNILYNYDSVQAYDTVICGHLCLEFLKKISRKLY